MPYDDTEFCQKHCRELHVLVAVSSEDIILHIVINGAFKTGKFFVDTPVHLKSKGISLGFLQHLIRLGKRNTTSVGN